MEVNMKFLRVVYRLFMIGLCFFIVGYFGVMIYAALSPKLKIESANSFTLYDKEQEVFFHGRDKQKWISLDDMSPYVVQATLAVEDKNFYYHNGFDFLRIVKAMATNVKTGRIVEGASTITQQYAKNLFLDFDKKWSRKAEEALLSLELEMHYSKDEILEGYLNTINYGGVYGIENASKFYFDKSASKLTLAEASILAGIPKSPSTYSPLADETSAKRRQEKILKLMVKNKYITEEERKKAIDEKLVYSGKEESTNLSTVMYYQDAVMRELKTIKEIPESFLTTGGLKVYTNYDEKAQTSMEAAIQNNLQNNQEIETSGVMIEPSTGKIIALTGGRDYGKSQYNRAIQSKRQVGSVMKPFLYYNALENGFTPSTTFISEPTTFTFAGDKTYSPSNYDNKYSDGPISMVAAIAYSDNIYAVKTNLFLGTDELVRTAKKLGVSSQLNSIPSLALGSEEINIVDMVHGYATLANEGTNIEPYLISKVEDSNGKVLYERNVQKKKVLDKSLTYILNDMLRSTYSRDLIDYNYPTCIGIAPKLSRTYGVKSGTTDTDLWTIGFNKDVVVGIWNGYDNNQKVVSSEYTYSKNIWADTIEGYLNGKGDDWYETPKDVVGVLVDPITGKPADDQSKRKKILYYKKGTEPYLNENADSNDAEKVMKSR